MWCCEEVAVTGNEVADHLLYEGALSGFVSIPLRGLPGSFTCQLGPGICISCSSTARFSYAEVCNNSPLFFHS